MRLTEAQLRFVQTFALSSDGRVLRDILVSYIIEVKDDALAKKISIDAANEAIQKLEELKNKFDVASGEKQQKEATRFD